MSNIIDFFNEIYYFNFNKSARKCRSEKNEGVLQMFIPVSESLKKLSKFFPENLYVVGGYVRNKILGLEGGDVDLCSSVDIEEVAKRLKDSDFSVKVKNLKLGSILISCKDESFEYTAFRKEVYGDDGKHSPIKVERTDKIEEDVVRRDFTINAIYYNINKDECVDLCHGVVDLSDKIIRTSQNPDEVFKNDGERILRMVRIAGELNFKISKETLQSAKKFASNLKDIQGSRKLHEIERILYCDKRYNLNKGSLKWALRLLNVLGVWQFFGLDAKLVKYKMTFKVEDRFLGLLIDIVDSVKPECLETFLEGFLKEQFGLNGTTIRKIFVYLAGYYNALVGMSNKEYFFKYFEHWSGIYPLLACKSKRTLNRYSFFYKYIIEHGLVVTLSGLDLDESQIKKNFPEIDKRSYGRILNNLLSKVFDGKVRNEKEALLKEIEKNLKHF